MTTLSLFDKSPLLSALPTKLRPYQSKAIQNLRDRYREGKRRILLVGPTGMGKMVIAASVIQTSSVPVLFVCHRLELVEQCVEQLARLNITNVGVMRANDERTNPDASTQVASIQTLARREKPRAGLVLVDEAHRSASDSMINNIFDAEEYRQAIILGFTATPIRYDGRPLGNLYDHLEIVTTYAQLIKDGFIIAPDCYGAPESPDLSSVRIVGGDYEEGALGEAMRKQSLIGNILDHWLKLAGRYSKPDGGFVEGPRRRTFIFAASIQHSLDICDRFAKAGIKIAHLDGTTPEAERRHIIKAIGDGELEAISNCNVLCEGVDVPSAKCVIHARPTQSLTLWRQTTGRSLRPWHPNCRPGCMEHPSVTPLLLDHANNIARHGFPHEDLHWELHEKARRLEKKTSVRICKSCYAYLPASCKICPFCGAKLPEVTAEEKKFAETQDQLVRRSTTPEDMQRAFYEDLVKLARKKGHKPGFAAAKFKEHYGNWPPWAWSENTRASFASDSEWQGDYEAKLTRVEKYRKQEPPAPPPEWLDVPDNDASEDPGEDDDIGF